MAKSFSQSHDAYNRGDHAGAKQFSTQGKQHQKRMDELNKEASDWIYRGLYFVFRAIFRDETRFFFRVLPCDIRSLKHVLFKFGSWDMVHLSI